MAPAKEKEEEKIVKAIKSMAEYIENEIAKAIGNELPCQLGSVLRIASQYFSNWGIKIDERELKSLERYSIEAYKNEWENVDADVYTAIHEAVIDSNLGDGNHQLNMEIAKFASEIIAGKICRMEKIVMADIGAGTGDTSGSILAEIKTRLGVEALKKIEIYFVEPADESNIQIKNLMKKTYPEVNYQRVMATDYANLQMLKKNTFDLVVSNAVFHHHSFPTYLHDLHRIIKKDGFLIIGDWYTEIWESPLNIAYLLKEAFRIKEEAVNRFIAIFDSNKSWPHVVEYWNSKSDEEKTRNEGMFLYVKNLAKRLEEKRKAQEKEEIITCTACPPKPSLSLNLLEAHERYEERLKKMDAAGFETDIKEIKRKYRKMTRKILNIKTAHKEVVPPKFAMVTLACKK
jgi:SAM-dependent methyltransferase